MSNHESRRICQCASCGETAPHKGKGLCKPCYTRSRNEARRHEYRNQHPAPALPTTVLPRPPIFACPQCRRRKVGREGMLCAVCGPVYTESSDYDRALAHWAKGAS